MLPKLFIAAAVVGFDQITRKLVNEGGLENVCVKEVPYLNRKMDTYMLGGRALSAFLVCLLGQYLLVLSLLAVVATAWMMTRRGMMLVVLLVAVACGGTMATWLPYWSSVTLQTYACIGSISLCTQPHVVDNRSIQRPPLSKGSQYRRIIFL